MLAFHVLFFAIIIHVLLYELYELILQLCIVPPLELKNGLFI